MAHGLVLRWSGCPGLSERVQCNHEVGAAKECGQPVEAKKKKKDWKMDFALEPPKSHVAQQTPWI